VRRGDTLWSIARSHGVTMESIVSSNSLSSDDTLAVGQVLQIPGTTTLAATDASEAVDTRSTTYVVRRGDTLSRIASKFRVRLSDLLGWNGLNSRSMIKPGQRLVMYVADQRAGI
jgi:membrane-bound lytic murein transglycosylase D